MLDYHFPSTKCTVARMPFPYHNLHVATAFWLLLSALFSSAALAKPNTSVHQQPPYGYGGSWTINLSGNYNGAITYPNGNTGGGSGQLPSNRADWSMYHGDGTSVSVSATCTVKLKWSGPGQPTQPPPIAVRVRLSANTDYGRMAGFNGVQGQVGSGLASNGKHAAVNTPYTVDGNVVGGRVSSSGGILVPIPPNTSNLTEIVVGTYTLSARGQHARSYISIAAQQLSRRVSVSSTIDPTYHRSTHAVGQGQRVINAPDSMGNMFGDTIAPLEWLFGSEVPFASSSATFVGTATGWNWNSWYEWSSSKGAFGEGTHGGYFHPLQLQNDTAFYKSPRTPVTAKGVVVNPGETDTIYLKVKDGLDSIEAESTYTLTFHDRYEEPMEVTVVDDRPRPRGLFPMDWQEIINYTNPSLSQAPMPTATVSYQTGHEVSIEGEQRIPPLVARAVGVLIAGEHISSNETKQISVPDGSQNSYMVPARTNRIYYFAQRYRTWSGKCSKWGLGGYDRDVTFSVTRKEGFSVLGPVDSPYIAQ